MPTGYTADIANGITFKEYALRCARNFGALIMMREEPTGAPIPDEFPPSDYYVKAIEVANKEISMLKSATKEELDNLASAKFRADKEYYSKRLRDNSELKTKYMAMLREAKAYVPPTDDHIEYANFLVSQIEESINWDCNISHMKRLIRMTGRAYQTERLEKLTRDVNYHTAENAKEVQRASARSIWVKELKKSLHI